MKINDLLVKDVMIMDLQATTKEAAIDEMIARLLASGRITDAIDFKEHIMAREAQTSTGLGDGIAMPHAKTAAVKEATVLFAKSNAGVNYESLDGQPAFIFFMIAAPEGANDTHLQALAGLSRLLIHPDFVASLKQATTPDEVQTLFTKAQADHDAAEAKETAQVVTDEASNRPFIVAVTACPTGIAHTYMAEDALKKKAAEMAVDIRVETNGSEGIQHRLTASEIDKAVAVIVAADKNVEMDRFDGKPVIQVPVSDGIRKTELLINRALKKEAAIFHGNGATNTGQDEYQDKAKIGAVIYKHLMSGVSNMLPFVVGGGILIALSFLFGGIHAEGPAAELFSLIGKGAFNFLVPILAGFIGMSIADRPGFMPAMVGGFLAANAGAGFFGGLAAGFLGGYVVVGLKKLLQGLPKSLDGIKPVLLYPVLGLFITGAFMQFVFNPPFIWLNELFTNWLQNLNGANAIVLGLVVGAMMAIDMGGPINKAAYTFGIAALDAGNTGIQASVVVAGMVPPLAIALASTFFKNKFTADEKRAGLTNYVMGLSFITEGAIPFAASDPLRVIISSVIGAATAGGLVQLWQVTYPAPHGGVFVVGLTNHPLSFLAALLIGSGISAVILGLWKKKVPLDK